MIFLYKRKLIIQNISATANLKFGNTDDVDLFELTVKNT